MLTIGFQLLGKWEKKLKIFLLKKARTILSLARKGLFQFLLVIFKSGRVGWWVGVSRPESIGPASGSPELYAVAAGAWSLE